MPNIGMSELLVVLMILLLVFGASRLPQLGEGLGKAIRNLKRGMDSDERIAVSKAEGPAAEKPGTGSSPKEDAEDAELIDRKS